MVGKVELDNYVMGHHKLLKVLNRRTHDYWLKLKAIFYYYESIKIKTIRRIIHITESKEKTYFHSWARQTRDHKHLVHNKGAM